MAWSLAGNLGCRLDHIHDVWPGMTIYAIGDPSHQSGQSDHNEDSRGVVHAIDPMVYSDHQAGDAIVEWCLDDTYDLEYVIWDRTIWSRSSSFEPRAYTGSNPHTDHVHISGRHGDVGYSSATGTGYDTDAEAHRPEGLDSMTPDQVKQAVLDALNTKVDFASNGVAQYASTIGSGDPISHRMMQEHMWARASIDNKSMTDPGPTATALEQLQSSVDALTAKVDALAAPATD